jgi:hypothetical protein
MPPPAPVMTQTFPSSLPIAQPFVEMDTLLTSE